MGNLSSRMAHDTGHQPQQRSSPLMTASMGPPAAVNIMNPHTAEPPSQPTEASSSASASTSSTSESTLASASTVAAAIDPLLIHTNPPSPTRLSNIRRRRSSAQSLPPPRRRRIQRLTESLRFWNRDETSVEALLEEALSNSVNDSATMRNDNTSAANTPTQASPMRREYRDRNRVAHFIDELDGITSFGNGASARARRLLGSGSLSDANRSAESSQSISFDHQIEMLSRLIELAATSTVRSLVGSTVANGRRFDNTSRTEQTQGDSQDSTFQEFVAQLHNGLLNAELSRNAGSEAMSFFRAFRFDSEMVAPSSVPTATEPPVQAESTTTTPAPSSGEDGQSDNTQQPTTENQETRADANVVPVMIIGLRAVQQPREPAEDVDWFLRGDRSQAQPDASNTPTNSIIHDHGNDSTNTNTDQNTTPHQEQTQTSWVIFVMGNSFEWNHPLLSAPSLMSENPTYDDLLILQDLIGQVKPQVTTKEELEKHDDQLFELVTEDMTQSASTHKTLPLSTLEERCHICLTDYEPNEIVRKLSSCNHLYHKECIDTWLVKGKNNCPLCRTKAFQSDDLGTAPTI